MRIIDADAMKRLYQEVLCNHVACIDCSFFMDDEYCKFETMLSEAPTVDAVPVVRCRECKYHEDTNVTGFEHCCLYGLTMRYNDFCSYGKREGGSDND